MDISFTTSHENLAAQRPLPRLYTVRFMGRSHFLVRHSVLLTRLEGPGVAESSALGGSTNTQECICRFSSLYCSHTFVHHNRSNHFFFQYYNVR